MGYAGYAPGNKVAESLTPLQQALRSLPLEKALELLGDDGLLRKLTLNVVREPSAEKFRRVKLTNAKIAAAVAEAPAIVDVLKEMGWVQEEDCLVLPPSVRLVHEVHNIALIDALDYWKKEAENERRRQLRARKTDGEKDRLREQMEVDRKEKDAEGPVTHGSVAQKLGDGPNIMRAGDVGIGKSSGG